MFKVDKRKGDKWSPPVYMSFTKVKTPMSEKRGMVGKARS